PDRVARQGLGHPRELKHHASRLDHGHPAFGRALAGAHARLGGLLRDRLFGGQVGSYPSPPLVLSRLRAFRPPRLALCQPAALQGLEPVLPELDLDLTARYATAASAVLLAVLDALGR